MKIIFVCVFLASINLWAKKGAELVVRGERVTIYTGPSAKYRPLGVATKGSKFPVSLKKVPAVGQAGEYYKVLVVMKPSKRKRVGYINTAEEVKLQISGIDEGVDQYQGLALAEDNIQVSFASLTDSVYQWSVGYQIYPISNLFIKGFAGQVLGVTKGSFLSGAEVGLDHFLVGRFSLYGTIGAGLIFPPSSDTPFLGSKNPSFFLQGASGVRYSSGEHAAISLGFTQVGYFNGNNSLVPRGVVLTLEIGL